MHQALQQMNIQLAQVLTDIGGTTGFAILRAIVAGERDSLKLAQLRDPRCKSSEDLIAKALSGDWKPEQLFVLQQSLELYDFYTQQLLMCDVQIEAHFAAIRPRWEPATELPTVPPAKPDTRSKNQPPASDPRRTHPPDGC
jgi:transposase